MTTSVAAAPPAKDWTNIAFLMLTPVIGILGTALYTWRVGFQPWMAFLLLGMYLCVGMSICAGYHRFFSHKSYECSPVVQVFYAFFGAMAAENSIMWWSAGHRIHHRYVDHDWDPYNIQRGFWWAHIVWIFYRKPDTKELDGVRDLEKLPVARWQHKWYKQILLIGGFGIPALVGALMGDVIAGLLWGGFLRIVVIHHTTFFVNSLAHTFGKPDYAEDVSARDNWMVALLTLGEGYHSFHHRFPSDYRNGIRWYHWDPAKWFIAFLRAVGLASELRSTPAPRIEQAKMQVAVARINAHLEHTAAAAPHLGEEIRARLQSARSALEAAIALWRRHVEERESGARRAAGQLVREARRDWQAALRLLATAPAPPPAETA